VYVAAVPSNYHHGPAILTASYFVFALIVAILIPYGDMADNVGSSTYSFTKFDVFAWIQSHVKLLVLGNSYVGLYELLNLQFSVGNRIKIAGGSSLVSIKFYKYSRWELMFVFGISRTNF
jgi:hypothetical protein